MTRRQRTAQLRRLVLRMQWVLDAGRGWAVFGETREQAIERFHEAVAKHMEIDARPMPQRPREAGDAL